MSDSVKEMERCLEALIDLYVCNKNTDGEFILCRTPKHASGMTFMERRENKTWRAFDDAREVLRVRSMHTLEDGQ